MLIPAVTRTQSACSWNFLDHTDSPCYTGGKLSLQRSRHRAASANRGLAISMPSYPQPDALQVLAPSRASVDLSRNLTLNP